MALPSIESDLRSWSREVLEQPSKYLKGMPPCPYAKQAWKQDKVMVVELEDIILQADKYCFDFDAFEKDLVILASYNLPDMTEFAEFTKRLNHKFVALHCMQFHPDYGAEDAELDFLFDNEWESSIDEEYCMLFIQDLELVINASDKLDPLGYYEAYPSAEYEALVVDRKRRMTWR